MTRKNDFGLEGLSNNVQFGKSGGRIFYDPETNTFNITLANQTTFANIKANQITSENGNIIINSQTGKITISQTNLSLAQEGVFKFEGTGAVYIPSGTMEERPATPAIGMVRINSEANSPYLEYYDGTIWVNTRAGGGGETGGPFDGEPSLTQYTYDSDGVLLTVTETIDGENRIANFTYHADGSVATITTTHLGQTRTETLTYAEDGTVQSIQVVIT